MNRLRRFWNDPVRLRRASLLLAWVALVLCFASHMMGCEPQVDAGTVNPPSDPRQYVHPDLFRYEDKERGVACYRFRGAAGMSCVYVGFPTHPQDPDFGGGGAGTEGGAL